jgi:capsular exopolysaccharide synthesis family protein
MVPTVQSGPNKWLLTILSAAIGLVFGVIGAYAIEYFDRTIKSTEEVAELTQLTILGRLKFSRKVKDRPQHLLSDPFSPETNVFRSIRTQLEKDGVGHSLRTILVISPDASEGKSTISLNLALIFSRIKKKVILVDSDYYKSSLSLILDAPQTPGLIDILEGKNELEDGLIPVCDGQILFLPSGGSRPEGVVSYSSEAMETVLTDLKIEAEVAIIDSPPYIIADAQDLAHQVDGILIIVRNRQTQHKALSKMMEQIRRLEIPLLGVVVNGIPQEEKGYQQYYYYRQHTPHKTGPTSSPVDNNHSDEIKGEELSSLPRDKGISQK